MKMPLSIHPQITPFDTKQEKLEDTGRYFYAVNVPCGFVFTTKSARSKQFKMAYFFLSLVILGSVSIAVHFIRIKRTNNKILVDTDTFLYLKERDEQLWELEEERGRVRYISPVLKESTVETCLN